ncbi:MAG: hypothetical protein JSV65_09540 [Armatimonadota bacterium]|nr:MAG: hypothetical protein JSV65_09540 [Armatimonadota bacterium]
MSFRLIRSLRTLSSEVYMVWDGERRVGQVDIHYADATVHATVLLEAYLSPEQQQELFAQLDEDIVSSYMPVFEREDFIIVVFRGEETESFSYPPVMEEE